jgi:type IV pilus assembly protein PilV
VNARGFSLLEVLIALVIFSFGLLALAALMAKGLQYNTSALHRSYASSQAYDMADRIRANHLGAAEGRYDSILGSASNPDCISDDCTPEQMAQFDHWEWSTTNAAVLPAGSGKVMFENPNYRITLTWDDDRDGDADDSFEFEFRP